MAFECPITLAPLRDPVRTPGGQVYEREAITVWLEAHGTDPLTRACVRVSDLRPARDVLRALNKADASRDLVFVDLTKDDDDDGRRDKIRDNDADLTDVIDLTDLADLADLADRT
jgi:hypothetical protein